MEQIVYQGSSIYDASLHGNFPLVVLIWGMAAAQQVSPFQPDADLNTAVHYAAVGGNVEILHFFAQQATLIDPDATKIIDAPNREGETPLIRAAHAGNVLAVKVLVDLGCDLLKKDLNGNTAAHHAAHQGHLWTLHYLLEAQVDVDEVLGGQCYMKRDVLQWACEGNQQSIIDYLLERGHDPNIADIEGRTALHHAILDGDKPLIKKLLSYGAKSDTSDDRGLTALSTANNMRRHTIVNMLLDNSNASHHISRIFTHPRKTRVFVMLLYAILWMGCLSLSAIAPWYIFLPGLLIVLVLSMRSMAASNHKHGKKPVQKVSFKPSVALTLVRQTRGSVFEIQENQEELATLRAEALAPSPNFLTRTWRWFKGQPEVAIGLWFGWLGGFTGCVVYRIYLDVDDDSRLAFWTNHIELVGVLFGMQVMCLGVWAALVFSDSGHVATSPKDFPQMLQQAATGFAPSDATHCTTCMVAKPIRSKHCALCGVCVARMDHHCVWINKCVGFGNHRLFITFLATHLAVLVLYLTLFLLYVKDRHTYLEILLQVALPELTVIFWSLVSCIFIGKLLWDQTKGILRNITVNELINWKRYIHLNRNDEFTNPFDLGWRGNFTDFFKHRTDYMTLFTIPEKNKAT